MSDYKTILDLELKGKRVFVRLDLNVPIKEGKITDYTRIDGSLKTIKYVIEKGGKAILASHFGRPEGKKDPQYSLKPVAEALKQKLGKDVTMAPDCIGKEVEEIVNKMKDSSVVLLENLRFYSGEEENDAVFSAHLAQLADVYVNDAFGTAHRAHASTYGVPSILKAEGKPVAAGFLMDEELKTWEPIVKGTGNFVAIVGGAKLEEKMKAVEKLAKSCTRIIVGGVVGNVFMKGKGYNIGNSVYLEKKSSVDYTTKAKELLDKYPNISVPTKVAVATKEGVKLGVADPSKRTDEEKIFADVIPSHDDLAAIKSAGRIVWFGPLGWYEKGFSDGSNLIVTAINQSKGTAVIGGGDLAAAAHGIKAKISTGGGASIQYITKGKLEALDALKN
jgi:phosphoglycerate kinase